MTKRLVALSLTLVFWTHVAIAADVPLSVNLIARDSLAGWDAGPEMPRGWSVKNGILRGERGASLLSSAWTFGDFEMTIVWRGHGLVFDFVAAPDGRRLSGATLAHLPGGEPRTMVIKRTGIKLVWTEREGATRENIVAGGEGLRLGIQLGVQHDAIEISEIRIKEATGKPLFNGHDLTGWWTPGNLASWPVIDEKIVCINDKGDYLRTEKEFGNFTLSLEYKMAARGNSGIGIRTPRIGWPSSEGMELQLMDEPAEMPITRHSTMSIYGNIGPLRRNDQSEQWNYVVVKAEGYMISAWMNGELVQQVNTFWQPELKHRFLKGWVGLQDHGARTEYRNINLLEAPSLLGMDAWYARRRLTGAQHLVDRLMNLQQLSRTSEPTLARITSLTQHQGDYRARYELEDSAANDGGQLIANLKGPGALVNASVLPGKGRLRFYLDGGQQPIVDCHADELAKHVPTLTIDEEQPLLYVPFSKQLRITFTPEVKNEAKIDYNIEFIPFDADTIVELWQGPEHTLPRELIPALSYRWEQHGFGGLRQNDRLHRARCDKQTVEAGARVKLVDIDGTGMVHWFRLRVPNKSLQTDELWLEVTVDGEDTPSIAAPVRYLFPGLDQGKNYQNFVVLTRDGFVNRLAMPYTQGISFAVVNRGKRALKEVEFTVAYDEKYVVGQGSRLQLFGEFQRADQLAPLAFSSLSRLVGTVVDNSKIPTFDPSHVSNGSIICDLFGPEKEIRLTRRGSYKGLAWQWFLESPMEVVKLDPDDVGRQGDRFVLYYALPGARAIGTKPAADAKSP